MLTAYLIALSFGGVLLSASLLLGGSDHDGDADHDVDVDHDIDVEHSLALDAQSGESAAAVAGDVAQGIFFNPLLVVNHASSTVAQWFEMCV